MAESLRAKQLNEPNLAHAPETVSLAVTRARIKVVRQIGGRMSQRSSKRTGTLPILTMAGSAVRVVEGLSTHGGVEIGPVLILMVCVYSAGGER